ncbi:cyclase family protein [Spirillospora sp. NPDC047279]|uniref:cyclase family protein n=1 Tax=Spirillospora sp. NPDC047279 TaxID=3155478 RepID=UPI0033FCF782
MRELLIDLSVPIATGMPVYPGDPEVELSAALITAVDGVNVHRLHLGSQTGTHVDAPFHIDDFLPGLDELPGGGVFTGPADVVDVRGLAPRTAIGPEALPERPAAEGAMLVFATGWSRHWGTGDYFAHPYLEPATAESAAARGWPVVGIDAPSVDPTLEPGTPGFTLAAHRALLDRSAPMPVGPMIVENLTGLDRVLDARAAGRTIEMMVFPLRLPGDGAPARVVSRSLPAP